MLANYAFADNCFWLLIVFNDLYEDCISSNLQFQSLLCILIPLVMLIHTLNSLFLTQ